MTWDIALGTIVTSSVTSGLIVLAITKALERQKRREEARLAVLYIVNQLETYAGDCLDWLQDQRLEDFALKLANENTGNKRGHSPAGIPGLKRGQS